MRSLTATAPWGGGSTNRDLWEAFAIQDDSFPDLCQRNVLLTGLQTGDGERKPKTDKNGGDFVTNGLSKKTYHGHLWNSCRLKFESCRAVMCEADGMLAEL